MNASDIVAAKQNKVLYSAYYHPNVYSSSLYTNIIPYSSIATGIINGQFVASTSYVSTTNTVYQTVCNPTFTSYTTLNQIKEGGYECGAANVSELQFVGVPNTPMYAFSTFYSTANISGPAQPYSFSVTSTLTTAPTGPLITPFVSFSQGPAQCNATNGAPVCQIGI
jgi:hypothetical protein